jgi:hypothetical protein
MRKRPTTTFFVLGAVLALATACGQAKAGTALPKGDDAADYVGAKFEQVMDKLGDAIVDTRDVKNSLDAYFRFDDKYIHSTITSARTGSPESRVSRNRSVKNPDEILDTFTPGEGNVEYVYLGPAYKSLASTAWVSMPKPEAGLTLPCVWEGTLSACKMADAAVTAYKADKRVVRGAKSLGEGKTALTVNVPFDSFLKNRVEVLPQKLLDQVGPELKKAVIPTTITLDADQSLISFVMDAKFEGDGHKLELKYDFRFTGKATAQDLPKIPDAAEVTVLPDEAAKRDFYDRLAKVQGS